MKMEGAERTDDYIGTFIHGFHIIATEDHRLVCQKWEVVRIEGMA